MAPTLEHRSPFGVPLLSTPWLVGTVGRKCSDHPNILMGSTLSRALETQLDTGVNSTRSARKLDVLVPSLAV